MDELDFRYYFITDRKACAPRSLMTVIEEACKNGIRAVQLREKDLSGRQLFELAQAVRVVTQQYDAKLFINDRVDIALSVGADGVHCRETSLSPDIIKKLDQELMVGASVHSIEAAREASAKGADFLLFGPVFYTPSKESFGQPQGIDQLRKVVESVNIPVFAVGGITPKKAVECLDAEADGIAGISSFMKSLDIAKTVKSWEKVLEEL